MKKLIVAIGAIIIVLLAVLMAQNKETAQSENGAVSETEKTSANNTIDLSNRKITRIPDYVFNLRDLEELNVSNNSLTGAIQSQIGQLVNLKVLKASNNSMTGVPAEIGKLQKLEVLDLSNNQLTGLPNELGNLVNLKTLILYGNLYSQQDLDAIRTKLPNTKFVLN